MFRAQELEPLSQVRLPERFEEIENGLVGSEYDWGQPLDLTGAVELKASFRKKKSTRAGTALFCNARPSKKGEEHCYRGGAGAEVVQAAIPCR